MTSSVLSVAGTDDMCTVTSSVLSVTGTQKMWTWRAGTLVQWLKLPAWKVEGREFKPNFGLQVSEKQNISYPLTRKKNNILGSLRVREVGCSASDRLCMVVSVISFISTPQEVLLAHFSLYLHKGGLEPHSFPFCVVLDGQIIWVFK